MNTFTSPMQQVVALSSVAKIATACNVSKQAVYKWLKKGYPPTDQCPVIEAVVGGKMTRFDLLPPQFQVPVRRRRLSTKS